MCQNDLNMVEEIYSHNLPVHQYPNKAAYQGGVDYKSSILFKKKHSHAWLVINSKHEYAKVDFGMLLKKKICELRQNLYFRMRPTEHNGARHRCVSVCDNFNYKIMNVIKEVKISSYNLTGAIKVYVSNNKPLRLLSFPH